MDRTFHSDKHNARNVDLEEEQNISRSDKRWGCGLYRVAKDGQKRRVLQSECLERCEMDSFARALRRSEGLCSAIAAVDIWVNYKAFLSISLIRRR